MNHSSGWQDRNYTGVARVCLINLVLTSITVMFEECRSDEPQNLVYARFKKN